MKKKIEKIFAYFIQNSCKSFCDNDPAAKPHGYKMESVRHRTSLDILPIFHLVMLFHIIIN